MSRPDTILQGLPHSKFPAVAAVVLFALGRGSAEIVRCSRAVWDAWTMSALPGSLSIFLPLLVKVLQGPGKMLIAVHGILTSILLWLTIDGIRDGHSSLWIPLIIAAVLAAGIITFAVRGARLATHVDKLASLSTGSTDVEVYTQDGRPVRDEQAEQRFQDAQAEAARHTARFMPRVEAAQRAAVAASGGTVNAPYLKPDLRITLVSAILTMAAGPLAFFLLIVTAIIT